MMQRGGGLLAEVMQDTKEWVLGWLLGCEV